MAKISAGILAYRKKEQPFEVFLVHPGGPFWADKDMHAWSVPKGEAEPHENLLSAAKREFKEETGFDISGNFTALEPVNQSRDKVVYAFVVKTDFDVKNVTSNQIEIEWPPKSDKKILIPEVDRGEWFSLERAKDKILKGQIPLLEQLEGMID